MHIGHASERSGVPAKTIRYYESVNLIEPASRGENGYRRYTENDVRTLQFVSRARSLGFSVKEVGALLGLYQDHNRLSADVRRIASDHVTEIDRKIENLQAMRRTLTHLVDRCHGDDRPDCPILDDLAGEA
jgi:MerR family copper efflux transcriptional regulator